MSGLAGLARRHPEEHNPSANGFELRCRGNLLRQAFAITIIRGWALYFRTCAAKKTFDRLAYQVFQKLQKWAVYRHRNKTSGWRYHRYWRQQQGHSAFSDGTSTLVKHPDTRVYRHIKVMGDKSLIDGDWLYWSARLGRDPTKPKRIVKLLKRQDGKCEYCGLRFLAEDIMEVHHRDQDRKNNAYSNLALLHGHCHDLVHMDALRL